jgi:lipopolysaccharide biosynthesis protein
MSFPARLRHNSRPRVLDTASGRVFVEQGTLDSLGSPDRLAILAHFSTHPRVSRSVRTLVRQLDSAGYRIVVVSAAEVRGRLEWNGDLPEDAVLIRQPNIGYDFGSWAIGLELAGGAREAERVILVNDSLIGPFSSIRPLLDNFEQTGADVWAMTDTYQYFHHLQSYFLGFSGGVLGERALSKFWNDIRVEKSKWNIIRNNELGLGQLLASEGFTMTSAFRADQVVKHGDNPVIRGWWRLLDRGFPFVKREIVRNPGVAPMADKVADEISATFGAQLGDWL